MALVIYDHGYRIQTPVKFTARGVEQLTQLQRGRALPPNTRKIREPDYQAPPARKESPTARQARQAYSQTATLNEAGRGRRAIPVTQVMTAPVFTITADASLLEAWQQMQEHQVHQLAVVDDQGGLQGLIFDRDLLASTSPLLQQGPVTNAGTIEGCYERQLVVATPDTEARLVALVLLERHTSALPVVSEEGNLVGIVTRSDLLHLIANDPAFEHWA